MNNINILVSITCPNCQGQHNIFPKDGYYPTSSCFKCSNTGKIQSEININQLKQLLMDGYY